MSYPARAEGLVNMMKPMVEDKNPCYQIYIKTNIYLFIIVVMLAKERHGEYKKVDRKTYIFK